jgi:hypothetical protein
VLVSTFHAAAVAGDDVDDADDAGEEEAEEDAWRRRRCAVAASEAEEARALTERDGCSTLWPPAADSMPAGSGLATEGVYSELIAVPAASVVARALWSAAWEVHHASASSRRLRAPW